ncbi:MAG: DUF72 domain-containing protein [Nitrospirae bacterium CG_4_10_14_0_8_um_filter_41_23]|nr:DUF72 domain-containing protein [Nitrospirota bacterium]OIP59045.1 MAG: hypothetical protein AUK38_06400 [Nitrospirae bacterium CG2_30_41_42]PIQ93300.1 MAG: hypothetical protein COV68_10600 [Nitrospirae bacterium CG11_big_fil_rev_8_21_14_0_20_41_14]PIV41055.1 MAG: DUF72 domain-containing protein [Nitrospirae bacterium CG02_land_8_20_14_3_00_41_53]PIW87429.1 MAG: DUF72 domain-containing protein [Nitrospirae bacterium CG_4_8_14_3_um_filter_41_47]PIY86419.1 MAG: DUF72 domain-containing protein
MADLRIGCSGFLYDHWRKNFYPEDLSKTYWLEYYSKHFPTIELNVTFHRLPERETFAKWYLSTPEDFVFSLKGSRFITHVKKLKDCAEPIEAFFSRASLLKEKLGVILWQFPPTFNLDLERFKEFLEALRPYRMRNAFELRNRTWINKKVIDLLEKESAAFCMADYPEFLNKLPLTADFVYIRRHGKDGSYATSYSTEFLKADAKGLKAYLKQKKDVFIYFNNDAFGYAPRNASELVTLMGKKK